MLKIWKRIHEHTEQVATIRDHVIQAGDRRSTDHVTTRELLPDAPWSTKVAVSH